ncbi:MAG: magnesium transporter CorA family protein [Elusimicrobiota bacterium]|jgi:magnesium transporter
MLRKYSFAQGRLAEDPAETAPVWVFCEPTEAEKTRLVDELKLDAHTLTSSLDPDEPARLEFEPDHLAVIFKRPKNYSAKDQFVFKVASAGLFLYKERLVVVLSEDLPLFAGKPFHSVATLEEVFLRLIASSIFHFLEHLRVINTISDEIERKINVSMENRYLINLFSLEKSLVFYLNAVNSNEFTFEKLRNNAQRIGLSQKGVEFLDDIVIENGQCYRQAEIYSNILASLMDARVSIVSNNLNILMKTLNFITIAIMVPTLVVSIFSMNVSFPMQQHPMMFFVILFLAVISSLSVLAWWQRHKH